MSNTYTQVLFHVVFSTHERQTTITPDILPRLAGFMGGIVRKERGILIAAGGTADHVHLLIRWRPDGALSALVRDMKSRASAWVHETFPGRGDFAWQRGYAAFSVSKSQSARVERYIANQAQHHKKRSFKEELLLLLKQHGIEYDERYLWN